VGHVELWGVNGAYSVSCSTCIKVLGDHGHLSHIVPWPSSQSSPKMDPNTSGKHSANALPHCRGGKEDCDGQLLLGIGLLGERTTLRGTVVSSSTRSDRRRAACGASRPLVDVRLDSLNLGQRPAELAHGCRPSSEFCHSSNDWNTSGTAPQMWGAVEVLEVAIALGGGPGRRAPPTRAKPG
jgi:hypothetical protein